MFWLFNDDKPWFAAKRFGLGSGLPNAWQGWVFMALHLALILGITFLLRDKPIALLAAVLVATVLPMPIYAARTQGGWHWRWGGGK